MTPLRGRLPVLLVALAMAAGLAMAGCGGAGPDDAATPGEDPATDPGEAAPPPPSLDEGSSAGGSTLQVPGSGRAGIGEMALAAAPLPRGGRIRAAVEVVVSPGLHVNANPPSFEYLIPITLSLEDAEGIGIAGAWYPEATRRSFPYSEEPYAVYEGSVVVGLDLEAGEAAPLGTTSLTVVLDYQACDDEACYAPARARAPLSVEIAPAGTEPEPRDSPLLARARFGGP